MKCILFFILVFLLVAANAEDKTSKKIDRKIASAGSGLVSGVVCGEDDTNVVWGAVLKLNYSLSNSDTIQVEMPAKTPSGDGDIRWRNITKVTSISAPVIFNGKDGLGKDAVFACVTVFGKE